MGRTGETCGAVTGAVMLISIKHGARQSGDKAAKEKTHELTARFMEEFIRRNTSTNCGKLLGFIIGKEKGTRKYEIIYKRCPGFVRDAGEILDDLLKK